MKSLKILIAEVVYGICFILREIKYALKGWNEKYLFIWCQR